jgi:hypothetical protein
MTKSRSYVAPTDAKVQPFPRIVKDASELEGIRQAVYVKLGAGGEWEADSLTRADLDEHVVRLGFDDADREWFSGSGYGPQNPRDWTAVHRGLVEHGKAQGVATGIVNQLRRFYEAGEDVIWFTFYSQRLWWCRAEAKVDEIRGSGRTRKAIGGWSSYDIKGEPLEVSRLSGRLTQLAAFRGTSCEIHDHKKDKRLSYLLTKLRGENTPDANDAYAALDGLEQKLEKVTGSLHPRDFEVLADLVLRASGWERAGELGGPQKGIDLELVSPLTRDRCYVQVKIRAGRKEFESFFKEYAGKRDLAHGYFIVHELEEGLTERSRQDTFEVIGPRRLAELTARLGLAHWLIAKAY